MYDALQGRTLWPRILSGSISQRMIDASKMPISNLSVAFIIPEMFIPC
jgi:hypothetical protein